MPGKGTKRSSYRLGEETRERLRYLSEVNGIDETEVVRRLVYAAWVKAKKHGWKINSGFSPPVS